MAKFDLDIGTEVHCQDGKCGKLHKVVLDPHTQQVTDLIVERGFLLKTDRVLPVNVVEQATRDSVMLSISGQELSEYPECAAPIRASMASAFLTTTNRQG